MTLLRCVALVFALTITPPAFAVQPDEMLKDPALETRARDLSRELRCMVCQNQSIDDSDAPLARDLRLLVRERLQAGDSDRAVLDFLVARYGEFVLLKPRFTAQTALLWIAPAVVLLAGAGVILWAVRRRSAPQAALPPLTEEEQRAIERLAHRSANPGHGAGPQS
jgi:cytochrome c-type biogenesis protein CcmH